MKKYAKLVSENDNVASCLADVLKGETVSIKVKDKEISCVANEDIIFGHKIAVKDIAEGEYVYKYEHAIGKATQNIKAGDWVHIHNVVDHYEVE